MKKNLKKFLTIFLVIFLILVPDCLGAKKEVSIPVNIDAENIDFAQGLFYSQNGLMLIDNVKLSKADNSTNIVFNVDGTNNDLVGVIVQDLTGNVKYSKMIPLINFYKEEEELPWCEEEKMNVSLLAGQESLLIELARNRKEQINGYDKKIAELLTDDLLFKISNLEKYFGFIYDKPIQAETSKNELLVRLQRLNIAVHNVKNNRLKRVRVERAGEKEKLQDVSK